MSASSECGSESEQQPEQEYEMKVQALLSTTIGIPDVAWTIDAAQVECKINHKKLPMNVCSERRDKWNISKVFGFQEWSDRLNLPAALCDAAFAFVDDSSKRIYPFSLSFAFSKSEFFAADGSWRARQQDQGQQQQQQASEGGSKVTFIEKHITEDPRVLNIIIFNMYTDLFLDVDSLTDGKCDGSLLLSIPDQYDMVSRPNIQCDILEVYKLAFFLGMNKLMGKILKYCLMPPSIGCPYESMEMKLACLLARCNMSSPAGEDELFKHAAETYVRYTNGLPCLCRWPLVFSKAKWDGLMQTARHVAHHWFAHVVPLYVYLFFRGDCSAKIIVCWAGTLGLSEAAKKPLALHLEGVDMRTCLESNMLGTLCLERVTTIPHVRSLARNYKEIYQIDLADVMGPDRSWVLPWAHMIAACAQIQSTTQEKSLGCISPSWLGKVCQDAISRYGGGLETMLETEEEVELTCRNRTWIVDRMLLGPMNQDAGSDGELECCSSKDMVVLQVRPLCCE